MSYDELKYDAQYFKNHSDHWTNVSIDLSEVATDAKNAKAPDGALWTTLVPGFKSTHDEVVEIIISHLLNEGSKATEQISTMLTDTCREYLRVEADNAAQAQQILNEVGF